MVWEKQSFSLETELLEHRIISEKKEIERRTVTHTVFPVDSTLSK